MRTSIFILFCSLALLPDANARAESDVLNTYADIAHAVYEDSATAARTLQQRIATFLDAPSAATLAAARAAWVDARVPYLQSEVFRFGNAIVDEWEGQINTWPLDEGLIDYVSGDYHPQLGNPGGELNIVANTSVVVGRSTIDLSELTPDLLLRLNELAGSEANVATGYHAIEFLLWGQDLNGTGSGAGMRPYTDYLDNADCTHGNCARRAQYLQVVTALLVTDLDYMADQWAPGHTDNYRTELLSLDGNKGLVRMVFGMGSLALGELAGERMQVALQANSPEDEQDCFSDNTHWSHFYNAKGIRNVYFGEYQRSDGTRVSGPSLSSLVAVQDEAADRGMRSALDETEKALTAMVTKADEGMKFDQMIAPGNDLGRMLINNAIDALVVETEALTQAARSIGIDKLNPAYATNSN